MDSRANATVMRKVKDNLHGSVFTQIVWVIEKLGVSRYWNIPQAQLELTYLPTKQKIVFRGADDPEKLKSSKFVRGYCKYVWYEELTGFSGIEEIRSINQSLLRGGKQFVVFYSYNPPKSINNWVNLESQLERPDRVIHHSDYRSVPKEWLGETFTTEAEHLKEINPESYEHEYLGKVTGTGGEVFRNIKLREITGEEIDGFKVIHRGLDFGYAVDPLCYGVVAYDKKYKRLYIFHEIYKVGMSNYSLYLEIKEENKLNESILADSAEPKSINELNQYGLRVSGVKKGKDSVNYGIKFLQDLEEIVIDPKRCPETAKEFTNYELEKDAFGKFKDGFPDKNNHTIDMVRYAMNYECIKHRKERVENKMALSYNFDFEKPLTSAIGGVITEDFFKKGLF